MGIYKLRMENWQVVTLYKYSMKKEKDNTYNKGVNSVDKKNTKIEKDDEERDIDCERSD